MFLYIFKNFISFTPEQPIKFLPPKYPPTTACLPIGTSPNWHFPKLALPPTGTFWKLFLCH